MAWPTVHVCCFMLARASTKTFVSRVQETAKKIFVNRKIRYQGHSLAEVSLYRIVVDALALKSCRLATVANDFIRWRLVFVDRQYGTYLVALLARRNLWCVPPTPPFSNLVHLWANTFAVLTVTVCWPQHVWCQTVMTTGVPYCNCAVQFCWLRWCELRYS